MPSPRYSQIDIDATPYYHCISRCVRRAFLCGDDVASGHNFDHRKGWVVEKLAELADIFAVGICAYAVLSNHFHTVLHIDAGRARAWRDDEVVARYTRLFSSTRDPRAYMAPPLAAERIRCWRARLADLSWFMRCLNEEIARRANAEDDCTGRFWEGRFRSQALLDEAGLLTCMSYVDLNPIRAGMAETLEESDFTSIRQRLAEWTCQQTGETGGQSDLLDANAGAAAPALVPLLAREVAAGEAVVRFSFEDYVDLLRETALRLCSPDPQADLPPSAAQTLERAGVCADLWLKTLRDYRKHFFAMVGCVRQIDVYCARTDRDWGKGSLWASRAFRSSA